MVVVAAALKDLEAPNSTRLTCKVQMIYLESSLEAKTHLLTSSTMMMISLVERLIFLTIN